MATGNKSNERGWVFSTLLLLTLASSIVLIFYVDTDASIYMSQATAILNEQVALGDELSNTLNVTLHYVYGNLTILRARITEEQLLVLIIDAEIERIRCTGVESINGVTPEPATRAFNITGVGGINVEPVTSGVAINATALRILYDAQQQTIDTLFNMTLATQAAIVALDGQVLKSINTNATGNNIDVDGVCGTAVYSLANGTVTVDMCALRDNATAAFAGVAFDFTEVNAQLDQLLLDVVTVINETDTVAADAIATEDVAIYTINGATSVGNNIDIVAGNAGIEVVNNNTIVNRGITSVNGLNTSTAIEIVPGFGISSTQNGPQQTLTNQFFIPPCRVESQGLTLIPPIVDTGDWFPLQQAWLFETKTPENCTNTDVFVPIVFGGAPFGQFNMPRGIWTLSMTMILVNVNGFDLDYSFAFQSAFEAIIFNSFTFTRATIPGTTEYLYSYYHLQLTLSNELYPEGTQFSLQYWANGSPESFVVSMTNFQLIRIA